ncbi:MAG: Bifunctional protein FolD [Patescibacteria group bacterium]|nr:Bifunctional protein FolD [Patescibacteria group bacterium]
MACIIDGKALSGKIKKNLRVDIKELKERNVFPGLAVVLAGDDPASKIYVSNKEKACQELGIHSKVYRLNSDTNQAEVMNLIEKLNNDSKIHGILVQLPLPGHIVEKEVIEAIDPKKDVDCFHPENVGRMLSGNGRMFPCTPAGVMEMLKEYEIEIVGKDAVVIGKSNIVGKPMAAMLLNAGATVTVCHSRTKDLKAHCEKADILVSAAGKAGLITADMIKSGAAVIDVGINRSEDGKIIGDVDFEKVKDVAGAITPVPGGVGPMTIAMLVKNTILATKILSL